MPDEEVPEPPTTPAPRDEDGRSFERTDAEPDGPTDEERPYTGEPVETDEGWVVPQQQNVGVGRTTTTAGERP
jgi:hypothetical protein